MALSIHSTWGGGWAAPDRLTSHVWTDRQQQQQHWHKTDGVLGAGALPPPLPPPGVETVSPLARDRWGAGGVCSALPSRPPLAPELGRRQSLPGEGGGSSSPAASGQGGVQCCMASVWFWSGGSDFWGLLPDGPVSPCAFPCWPFLWPRVQCALPQPSSSSSSLSVELSPKARGFS